MNQIQIVDLAGSGRNRGRIHGEALRTGIETSLLRWQDELGASDGLRDCKPADYLERLVTETGFVATMRNLTPDLVNEIAGIAEGSGRSFTEIAALNLMDEEVWLSELTRPESCTSVACQQENGNTIAGQTMDLTDRHADLQVLLRINEDDHETIILSSAGMIGLCGVSGVGFGVFCNQLVQLAASPLGLPVAAVTRTALASGSLAEAQRFIDQAPHASGQNYLLAERGRALCFEASAKGVALYETSPHMVHTNHPLAEDAEYAEGRDASWSGGFSAGSLARLEFVSEGLSSGSDLAAIREVFADRTVPVCKVPEDKNNELTFGAMVAELSESGARVWLTMGPPDRKSWSEMSLR